MPALLTVLTSDHIIAYANGELEEELREPVEALLSTDDRARRTFAAAQSAAGRRDGGGTGTGPATVRYKGDNDDNPH